MQRSALRASTLEAGVEAGEGNRQYVCAALAQQLQLTLLGPASLPVRHPEQGRQQHQALSRPCQQAHGHGSKPASQSFAHGRSSLQECCSVASIAAVSGIRQSIVAGRAALHLEGRQHVAGLSVKLAVLKAVAEADLTSCCWNHRASGSAARTRRAGWPPAPHPASGSARLGQAARGTAGRGRPLRCGATSLWPMMLSIGRS